MRVRHVVISTTYRSSRSRPHPRALGAPDARAMRRTANNNSSVTDLQGERSMRARRERATGGIATSSRWGSLAARVEISSRVAARERWTRDG